MRKKDLQEVTGVTIKATNIYNSFLYIMLTGSPPFQVVGNAHLTMEAVKTLDYSEPEKLEAMLESPKSLVFALLPDGAAAAPLEPCGLAAASAGESRSAVERPSCSTLI